MTKLIDLEEAQEMLLAFAKPDRVESIPVIDALDHYLIGPLCARRTQPAADLSSMDGYAVGSVNDRKHALVGESAAGYPFAPALQPGTAIRISTGAVLPFGTASVWPQEICALEDGVVGLIDDAPVPPDKFFRRVGSDFTAGSELLPAGQRIGPSVLALALSAGHTHLPVHRKPRLAILETGDELSADPNPAEEHRVPACNGIMVAAMLRALPCEARLLPIVPDRVDALTQALNGCDNADVVVFIGGASVGDHDLVHRALMDWGADLAFWRVAIKPGKPLLVARRGRQIVLGLPGNPASAFVTAFLFLLPLVRRMLGAHDALPRAVELPLGFCCPAGGARREFLRARVESGKLSVTGDQHSSLTRSLAVADYLIDRPAWAPPSPSGSMVKCYAI